MQKKLLNKKRKQKISTLKMWTIIMSSITIIGIVCLLIGIGAIVYLLKDMPDINSDDFKQEESSIIYDNDGIEIANLGSVIRQNIDFDELPNCVIDAFVAVEDSRFFEHNGFDVPRFTKAILGNLKTMSFSQGGSTFTMQLVKNTYFVDDETGQEAAREGMSGIKRKVQEIALAMKLNNILSKENVFASYVNKLNYGGDYNIRGIQKAAQYYFNKDIDQCNLVESAMLAGVINAPNYYNPYYNLEAAKERTDTVLYLMNSHGYISDKEYEIAKTVKLEDLLDNYSSKTKQGEGIPYQAYIDQVVGDVMKLTNLDPYTTTMHIYTYMNRGIQEKMDDIQAGNMDDYLVYPDEYFEVGSACVENSTGAIVGILGGRNYAGGGQLLLNHATDQYKQPGSTMKPILDYALAFENCGWATDHVLTDKPMFFDSTGLNLVYNDSGKYVGDVTLKDAVGQSINTCAIQTLQEVINKTSYEYVVNYCQTLGYKFNLDNFNIQYGIGGSTCEVTPLQQAAAYAAIMNYGTYNEPHTIKRIEFTNGKSPITPNYQSRQVISDAAAYMTSELMRSNVNSYGGTYSYVKADYPVYGKTGTTDYGISGKEYGIPSGAINSGWLVAATSEYTTCTWVGYEKMSKSQPSYISNNYYYNDRPQGKIAHLILDATVEYGKNEPTNLTRPSSVTSIQHVIGTFPYAAVVDNMDESLITTGLIKSDSAKLVTLSTPKLADMSGEFKTELDGDKLKITWPEYPDVDEQNINSETKTKKMQLKKADGTVLIESEGACLFDPSWIYGGIKYGVDITVTHNDNKTINTYKSDDKEGSIDLVLSAGDIVEAEGYYCFENGEDTSNKISAKKIEITKTVILPSKNATRDELIDFANRYSFVEYNEQVSDMQANKFTISYKGASLNPGSQVTVKDSDIITITYYYREDLSVVLASTSTGDGKCYITATVNNAMSDNIEYFFSIDKDIEFVQDKNKISIDEKDIIEPIVVTVEVNDGYSEANYSIEIKAAL